MTSTRPLAATATALAATLGLAAISWGVVIHQMAGMDMAGTAMSGMDMGGMDMGASALPGPFFPFIASWVVMMAAMMLPGLAPTLWRRARAGSQARDVLLFIGSYLAVWGLFGLPVYALYRPHGTMIAGVVTIAAGIYELTPLKWAFRRRCCEDGRSGFTFGLSCLGSSIGLMLMQVSLGLMSITWMVVASIIIVGQKLLRPRLAVDLPVALAIIALGTLIIVAPSSVPGLMPAM